MIDDSGRSWVDHEVVINGEQRPRLAEIKRTVARYFGLPLIEMSSQRSARSVARPRQIGMYLAKQLTNKSSGQIAAAFGKRDHTTALHAFKVIASLKQINPAIDSAVRDLTRQLSV